jgi:hypothetical protein
MAARAFGKFLQHLAKADIDVDTLALGAMLVGSGYTPNYDVHEFRSDVTSEVTGTGYTAGGIAQTGELTTLDATNHWLKIDADDADFGTLTVSGIVGMVLYVVTGSAATDYLVSMHTFASQSPSASPFKYQFHVNGIGTIAY